MEVHAHTSRTSGTRKKWRHYFWEFLMLFLAVFCGFLAEYQLEHKIEKDRAKQYLSSLLQDLKEDSVQLSKVLYVNAAILAGFDTLLATLANPVNDSNFIKRCYAYSLLYTYSYQSFSFAEVTIAQLKNSGGLRMIGNKTVREKIMEYDVNKGVCLRINESLEKYFHIVE